jgi:hypothetical protein
MNKTKKKIGPKLIVVSESDTEPSIASIQEQSEEETSTEEEPLSDEVLVNKSTLDSCNINLEP